MNRSPRRTLWRLAAALAGVVAAAPAGAQPSHRLEPVDQAVGDLDSLSTSLRRLEPGLRTSGEGTSLFRAVPMTDLWAAYLPRYDRPGTNAAVAGVPGVMPPTGPVYYRLGPGFRARVDHLDYLVRRGKKGLAFNETPRRDGEFIELLTAGAVFELDPQPDYVPVMPRGLARPSSGAAVSRVPSRVNAKVEHRVNPRAR